MVAIPWDGPPAMSGRGFASVLFEATANPALATPFRKPYAQRNYFMISRTFMNLQSRFGFHFAAVEAVLGDRDRENYLSFSFKGGAADLERKSARVRFLTELLEEHGFEVRAIEDTASARLAGLPAEAMADRVEIIGYLLMHTRQLDMIMTDPSSVAHYRDKMRRDIATLVDGTTPGLNEG
jgi:pyruvate,water dikinase